VRASERNGEVILEIYDPSARGTTAVGTRPDVLEAIRKDVCMHCVEYGEDGKCHHESDTECSVFHFLPELVRISNQIHSEKMDDYIAAVRSRVCALCSHAEGEKCSVREQLDCALDRYLSLVIDSLERLQDTLEHTRKAA
jgi:hypothetical protein